MSRLGLWLIRLLRGLLGLAAFVLVLLALYVSLGRELAPLVAEYHDEVEQRASQALGLPVRIGRLQGEWSGLAPRLVAYDVELGDGQQGLQLQQIAVVPAVLDSLLTRAPRLRHVELAGLQLRVAQDAAGDWQLQGLPSRQPGAALEPQQLLAALGMIQHLTLLDSQLIIQRQGAEPLSLTYLGFTLHTGRRLHLDARVTLPDGQPLALQLKVRPDLKNWQQSPAQLYLSLPQSNWAQWLPQQLLRDWRFAELKGGGELWLDWQGRLQGAVARLHLPSVKASHASYTPQQFSDLGFTAHFRHTDTGYRFVVEELGLTYDQRRWGPVVVGVEHQHETDEVQAEWRISADELQLAPIAHAVNALAPLPDKAREVLKALRPRGTLSNLQVDWRPQREGAKRLEFAANLEQVGVSAWEGAPAAENVSGSVSGDLQQGQLRLASEAFGLHFATLFPELWRYHEAGALLKWQLNEQELVLNSPYLRLRGDEGELAGDFTVRLMRDAQAEDYMDLRVGLRQGQAQAAKKYLPSRSPGFSPELAKWLDEAIRGARIEEGVFEYQGSLMKGADPAASSIGLYFKVSEAELDYQPGWPALRQAAGEVWVEDSGVQVRVSSGQLHDSRVRQAVARVPHVAAGQVPRLLLQADLDSSVEDALRTLREAPIPNQDFADWRGQGALSAKLQLDIPLAAGAAPGVQVAFSSEDASLQLSNPVLSLSRIKGDFNFDLAKGLSAQAVSARVLEHEVRGRIRAEGSAGRQRTRIEVQGRAPLKPVLDWLAVSQPLPLRGELPYQLQLNIEGADSLLTLDSDLRGLAIDLPPPFGKTADERRTTRWRMTLAGAQRRYQLEQPEQLSLVMQMPPGDWARAATAVVIGPGKAILPAQAGLRVRGELAEFSLEDWQAALKPYAQNAVRPTVAADVALQIGRFRGFGIDQQQVGVTLQRAEGAWKLGVDSPLARGKVSVADASGEPMQVSLDYLSLPKSEALKGVDVESSDPLGSVDPRILPAMDVQIAKVLYGNELLGSWRFKARPQTQGSQFSDLQLELKGMLLNGSLSWNQEAGGSRTTYQGRLAGGNLRDVLTAWGYAPTVSSEHFRLDVAGDWPGSPAGLSLKRFSGTLDASLRKGAISNVEGGAQALRVFGLLNFNAIGRRLRLDFSDLFGEGLAYDRMKVRLEGPQGVFVTREPLRIEGPSTLIELNGTLDMARDQINAKLLVSLPVSNNLPLAALIAGAPAIGGALFVVDKLLGDRVARVASVKYHVSGPWQDPQISFLKPDQQKP
ncbi:TIGR02099 family protein [Pseudomonas sp. HAR-UPW-AIA-41]|uniref:YhdP family protein n=1 Tax=Pseudomonas sp. HAR-UPW-AIA-41 TaxID=1985301 RepID=UPI000BB34609|nr:YhdP family protein [Pseudomonas sp. HAR-UPW-AIA-41]PAV47676.1 TIGR02099 family protein [Pseudomonas sp. HAR-UPW-AIA-41]